jgi:hypothetical protein
MSHGRCGKCHRTDYPLVDPSICSACAWDLVMIRAAALALGGVFYFLCLMLAAVGYVTHLLITSWAH